MLTQDHLNQILWLQEAHPPRGGKDADEHKRPRAVRVKTYRVGLIQVLSISLLFMSYNLTVKLHVTPSFMLIFYMCFI